MEEVNCNCGIFVAHSLHDVYNGLQNLQHRGEDACGIATSTNEGINILRWKGKVKDLERNTAERILEGGSLYIGEIRYSTRKGKSDDELFEGALPRYIHGKGITEYKFPNFPHKIIRGATHALVHNGNLIGVTPRGKDTDSDVLLKFFSLHEEDSAKEVIETFPAAYSAAVLDARKDFVTVFTDRYAIRPLWIGEKDGRLIASSEDIAITRIGGDPIREFRSGEIIEIRKEGTILKGRQVVIRNKRPCFFERNYLGHVLSSYGGILNKDTRRRLGVVLAEEYFPDVDIVSDIPNAPEDYARAYSDFRNIFFQRLFYKVKVDRSFLSPDSNSRTNSIKSNLYVQDNVNLEGKKILLIDDSIIRFNNAPDAIRKLKEKGISWIGLAIGTPPIGPEINGTRHGCYYGVDMPIDDDFIIRKLSLEEMAKQSGLNEIYFISKRGLERALRKDLKDCCAHCIGEPNPVLNEELISLDKVVEDVYLRF